MPRIPAHPTDSHDHRAAGELLTALLAIALMLFPAALGAQQVPPSTAPGTQDVAQTTQQQANVDRVLLAVSSTHYPVVPGDVYRLTYRTGGQLVTTDIMVDSNYALNLGIFGAVDGRDKTFRQVKEEVERIVSRGYPNSLPNMNLVSVGLFEVIVRGAIPQTAFVTAWGLSRLSDIIQPSLLAAYSSIRDIEIRSRDGSTNTYDLLSAIRGRDEAQNPYIEPGDVIMISEADRVIDVRGEVYRPGKYQLLEGETIEDFVFFAGGLTQAADPMRIKLERREGHQSSVAYFELEMIEGVGSAPGIELHDGDVLTVPSKSETMPVVFIEGAVDPGRIPAPVITTTEETLGGGQPAGVAPAADPATPRAFRGIAYNRITYPFTRGETLFNALSSMRDVFMANADLSRAYVIRQDSTERIPIDLERLLYDYESSRDIPLTSFDRIVIPASSYDISVSGDVTTPGSYPFVPERRAGFYVGLAGGIDIMGNVNNIYTVFDVSGTKKTPDAVIEPGDRIFVHPESNLVSVNGAVITPGAYPYIPQEGYLYYISKAGGIDFEQNSGDKVTVYDVNGKKRPPDALIEPGDRIYVHSNSFFYNFNRYFPVIATGLTFVTTIVTLVNLLGGVD